MKASIRLPLLMVIAGYGLAPAAIAQVSIPVDGAALAVPPAISADMPPAAGYPPKPDGIPANLHRQVVKLYERLHAAYPDAPRQRIFSKIADELGIAPERLWNAYHDQAREPTPRITAPPTTDFETLARSEKLTRRIAVQPLTDPVRSEVRAGAPERVVRVERLVRAERAQRLQPARPTERPQRGR